MAIINQIKLSNDIRFPALLVVKNEFQVMERKSGFK
jgi:hypothetical protein